MRIFIALEEFRAGAVRVSHLPERLAAADRRPCQLAQVERLARLDGDVRLRVLAEARRRRTRAECSCPAGRSGGEAAMVVARRPELVVLGVGLPVDRSAARPGAPVRVTGDCVGRDMRGRPGGWSSSHPWPAGRAGRAGPDTRRAHSRADNRRPRPSRTAIAWLPSRLARPHRCTAPAGRRPELT